MQNRYSIYVDGALYAHADNFFSATETARNVRTLIGTVEIIDGDPRGDVGGAVPVAWLVKAGEIAPIKWTLIEEEISEALP